MTVKLVCIDCGKKFNAEVENDVFTPADCPSCGMTIGSTKESATSDDTIATTEE